ncbi:NUDIX hydrolase [Simkania negevensis]|uniref:ADP-ribose pyrophosphatase n=1 Tax=Simkania negevensis (strain ATCC VR-1471 / DSM 27360 / Z) TaxID=331113 RepID=F8L683_SIMNZ|nr:NUDIX domain-containing protein [Simkania negevensis]CCB88213.1 ADP-ribose pyrophosphatase [Simkania negevensis Z]
MMVTAQFYQSEKRRFKMKVGVSLVLFRQEEVLLLRRYNTGIDDGCYVLPMGGVDRDETAIEALVREAKEEVNITVHPDAFELVHTMHRLHHLPDGNYFEQIDLFFKLKYFSGEVKNMEPHKCDEVSFYPLDALPKTTVPFICQALDNIRNGVSYSECGWEKATV